MKALWTLFLVIFTSCAHEPVQIFRDNFPEKTTANTSSREGKKYMVVTQGKSASKAGRQMFELGGNAVDAAVAVSFAISVERPQSTGLGGGGFMLLKPKNASKPQAIDFREKAPMKAHSKIFLDDQGKVKSRKSLDGIFAAGVPGLVAGLLDVHEKYGKLPLTAVISPAIRLAENGFPVYPELEKALKARENVLARYPGSKKIFFKGDRPLKKGEKLIQKDLGKSLREIAKHGRDGFYKSWVAKKIVEQSKKLGGLLEIKDFFKYKVKYRKPIYGSYRDHDIFSMPPPSSGGIHIVQILNILEKDELSDNGSHQPRSIHLTASAMQQAFADRARHLGDSDFVDVPRNSLTSKSYAREVRQKISSSKARNVDEVEAGKFKMSEKDHTTHFTIADSEGNIVSSTQTINGYFGSGVVAEGTGIVLNNEMDDFAADVGAKNLFGAVGGEKNLVEPGKRPLSSMSPTIVMKKNRPIMALGSPSGTRILTCVAQMLLNKIEYEMSLWESMRSLRYHHHWKPDSIRVESPNFSKNIQSELKSYGHEIVEKNLGCRVQAISFEKGKIKGASDPRGEGLSLGL